MFPFSFTGSARNLLPSFAAFLATILAACLLAALPARAEDYLAPEVAFKFSARMLDPSTVAVTYDIADGYYMYRERFKFSASGATLGAPS